MTVCFVTRAYIRIICFGRLLLEDWLVAVSLLIFITCVGTWQVYMKYMYDMEHAVEGTFTPGPTFIEDTRKALQACGALAILVYVGLWLIKASFLVLFYRLGRQIRLYLYAWWACSALVIACGNAGLGLNQYGCIFGDIDNIFATCLLPGSLHDIYVHEIVASLLDVISDVLSEFFPSPHVTQLGRKRSISFFTMMLTYFLLHNFSHHLPHLDPVEHSCQLAPKTRLLRHLLPCRPYRHDHYCQGGIRENHHRRSQVCAEANQRGLVVLVHDRVYYVYVQDSLLPE